MPGRGKKRLTDMWCEYLPHLSFYTTSAGICMCSVQRWSLSSQYDINAFPRIPSSLGISTDVCCDCWYFQIKIYVMLNKWVDGAREMSFPLLQDIKIVHRPICHRSSGYTHACETFKTFELKEHVWTWRTSQPVEVTRKWELCCGRFQEFSGQVTVG